MQGYLAHSLTQRDRGCIGVTVHSSDTRLAVSGHRETRVSVTVKVASTVDSRYCMFEPVEDNDNV